MDEKSFKLSEDLWRNGFNNNFNNDCNKRNINNIYDDESKSENIKYDNELKILKIGLLLDRVCLDRQEEIKSLDTNYNEFSKKISNQKEYINEKLNEFYKNKESVLNEYVEDAKLLHDLFEKVKTSYLREKITNLILEIGEICENISDDRGSYKKSNILDKFKIGEFSIISNYEKPIKEQGVDLDINPYKAVGRGDEFFIIKDKFEIFELTKCQTVYMNEKIIHDLSLTYDEYLSFCRFSKGHIDISILNDDYTEIKWKYEIVLDDYNSDSASFSVLRDCLLVHEKSQVLMFDKETLDIQYCWTYANHRNKDITNKIYDNICYQYFNKTGLIFESYEESNRNFHVENKENNIKSVKDLINSLIDDKVLFPFQNDLILLDQTTFKCDITPMNDVFSHNLKLLDYTFKDGKIIFCFLSSTGQCNIIFHHYIINQQ